jgi:drug/metabolite transporter (DMT)-like permease
MMIGSTLSAVLLTAALNRWEAAPLSTWLIMVTLGLTGVLAFGAILAAAEIAPASQTALSGYLIPLIGVLGGVLLFDERFGWRLALGGLLVLTGVVLVGQAQRGGELVSSVAMSDGT